MTTVITSTTTPDVPARLAGVNAANVACAVKPPSPSTELVLFEQEFDNGASVLSVGMKAYFRAPCSGSYSQFTLIGDAAGSVQVDVWKKANAIPTVSDKISGSGGMALSAAQLVSSADFTGWTGSFSAGDIFCFNIASATTIKKLSVQLQASRTN